VGILLPFSRPLQTDNPLAKLQRMPLGEVMRVSLLGAAERRGEWRLR
jgi:hypothetical protein